MHRNRPAPGGIWCVVLCAMLLGCGPDIAAGPTTVAGLRFRSEQKTAPRPLHIFSLEIDLTADRLELAAVIAADPDGDGPAEGTLSKPLAAARKAGLLAAVNSNAFSALPDNRGRKPIGWRRNQPVRILGLAAAAGVVRSQPESGYVALWTDTTGRPHIGQPAADARVRVGCAGFGWLVRGGSLRGGGLAKHPRTAAGIDKAGRRLWLVVVDGRRSGYSEGMTTSELATYMRDLGCWDAVNLDGGGSSVMMLAGDSGQLRVVNRPSDHTFGFSVTRPVPVLIGVRRRQ